MKKSSLIIFFSLVLILYALINYYIIKKGLMLLPSGSSLRTWLIILIAFFASVFLVGRFLERLLVNWFTASLIWIGSFWLAIMVYLLLQVALIDLFRGVASLFGIFPDLFKSSPKLTREIAAMVVLSITFIVVLAGHINTWFPKTKEIHLKIYKSGGKLNQLHIVALSDIHLGTIIEKRHMKIIVNRVNLLNPDIILIPGDIIDEDIRPVISSKVGDRLLEFKSKYGVYAVTGNHEYIGGVHKAKKFLSEHNILLLNDTAVLIDDSFYLAGREDLTINQFLHKKRKALSEIVSDIDKTKPVILLDHQPFKLEQAEQNGIDLQLSGHTHHGQLWPFNFITRMVYEISWGYKKKGQTHYYVSSGVGGWGPPIRTVNRPEIISIKLTFNKT